MFQVRQWIASCAASRRTVWGVGLVLPLNCTGIAGTALAPKAKAATLSVPGDFPTIQGCIDAAVSGQDECVVAPGTYNELINFNGKAITLRSSDGAAVTIIDAGPVSDPGTGKPVVRCDTGEGPDTVLDGFTLTGGTGSACDVSSPDRCGGGMYNLGTSPTVTNCIFIGNTVNGPNASGGGMYNLGGGPTVTNTTFSGNAAKGAGASLGSGGGMWNEASSPTVANCIFDGNSAIGMIFQADGGGVYNASASNPTLTSCTFSGNAADNGGGMYAGSMATNCMFTGNSAVFAGGGMCNFGSPTVTNCAFSGNSVLRI